MSSGAQPAVHPEAILTFSDMEQQSTGQRVLDPIERAKLGIKVLPLPLNKAVAIIDEYVSGKNYDQASVDYFKEQVATQNHIKEKGTELVVTTGEILKLVVGSFIKNLPKPPANSGQA